MALSLQKEFKQCECGSYVAVVPLTAWEFEWRCAVCHRAGVIAWARAHPPPQWAGAESTSQCQGTLDFTR